MGRNRKIRIFESSIERLGRILSRKWKVNVVFKHNQCKTDGSTIFLPVLPDNASKDLMDAMQGHLDHEAAHVVFSDFSVIKRECRKPKLLTVLNALEDPRIEKRWQEMYPGAKVNLNRSEEWALRKVAETKEMVDPEDGKTKDMRSWDGLTQLGKLLYASIVYTGHNFDDSHWFLKDVVEPDVMKELQKHEDIFRKSVDGDTTEELVALAQELLDRLGEVESPEPEQIAPEDIPDDAKIVPGGGNQQASVMQKQPKPDPNAPPTVSVEPMMSADTEKEEKGENTQQQGEQNSPYNASDEELEKDSELVSRNEQLREAAKEELDTKDRYLVYSTEGDKIERIKDGDRVQYKRFMQDAVKYVAPMKRKMSRSMLATRQSRWECDKTRGKINPRRVYQVPLGTSKRVFRHRVESEDFDTCVLMMIDHSGSMAGHQLDLAAKTAIVFGELLHQLGIPFSVLGFSTDCSSVSGGRYSSATPEEQNLYTRWGNLWIGEYKNFSDSWSSAGPKMINMVRNGKVNTYDGESLRLGAQILLARPEKRKIMFWLNDGYPCPNYSDDSRAHVKYAHDCAKEVEKYIELFAIGINTDEVKKIYSNCVRVNNLEELPKTCLAELDALIRKGKTYRGAA